MSPGDGADTSCVFPFAPPPAVKPRAEFVNASLHCKTPWSRTSTLGEATTGEAGAQEETPTGADQHAGAVAEPSRCPLLSLGEGHHRPPGSAPPAADGAPARAASSATSRRSAS